MRMDGLDRTVRGRGSRLLIKCGGLGNQVESPGGLRWASCPTFYRYDISYWKELVTSIVHFLL